MLLHTYSKCRYRLTLHLAQRDEKERIFVLNSSEWRPWPGLTPLDSAQEIRLDPSPGHRYTNTHLYFILKQWYKHLIAQCEEYLKCRCDCTQSHTVCYLHVRTPRCWCRFTWSDCKAACSGHPALCQSMVTMLPIATGTKSRQSLSWTNAITEELITSVYCRAM